MKIINRITNCFVESNVVYHFPTEGYTRTKLTELEYKNIMQDNFDGREIANKYAIILPDGRILYRMDTIIYCFTKI